MTWEVLNTLLTEQVQGQVILANNKAQTIIDGGLDLVNSTPFISVFRTTTANESITLPYVSNGTYSGTIDWGDGTVVANTYANRTHTYTIVVIMM